MRFISLVVALLCVFLQKSIVSFLVGISWIPWILATLLPKIILIALLLHAVVKAYRTAKSKLIWFLFAAFFSLCFAGAFWQKPIYASDYSDKPEQIAGKFSENKLRQKIAADYPEFNGAVVFVDPDCPHCSSVAEKFNTIKQRKPERDVVFVLFTLHDSVVDVFKRENEIKAYPVLKSIDELSTVEINAGSFPTITYFRNGDFATRWFGNDFGYITFDRIEAGLE